MGKPAVVYALIHEPTGKVYVGSTRQISSRIQLHMEALKRGAHKAPGMQDDYNKYGGPYTVRILEVIRGSRPTDMGSLWMDALGSRDPERGYNARDPSKKRDVAKLPGVAYPMDAGAERDTAKEKLKKMVEEIDRKRNAIWLRAE